MPHAIIECSENLLVLLRQQDVCREAYATMQRSGLFGDADIKTRLIAAADSYVGLKGHDGRFVHAQIYLMEGRPEEAQAKLAADMCATLSGLMPEADSVTVNVTELRKAVYQKKKA